jgi:hypothetical protein
MSGLYAEGNLEATYARVYAGGITGTTKTGASDIIDNCLSYVNVKSRGTGRVGSTNAAYSYAGGIVGYMSYAENVSYCYYSGTLEATAIDGTDAVYINKGMFGGAQNSSNRCNILLKECYFDIDKLGLSYDETYSTPSAIAEKYTVGNCSKLKTGSTAYGITAENAKTAETFTQFDFENFWEIKEEKPMLKPALLPITLPMENVSIEENVLSWEAVRGAQEYYVYNVTLDKKITVYGLSYVINIEEAGTYEFKIGAKVFNEVTDYSESLIYTKE